MALVIDIPGFKRLELAHLVLDLNGTLARDGQLLGGVRPALMRLAQNLSVRVVTADTFGTARALFPPPLLVAVLTPGHEGEQKRDLVLSLGAEQTAALGNGANDALMLSAAGLAVAVIGPEGAATSAIQAAHLAVTDSLGALELLLHPQRLIATLRR